MVDIFLYPPIPGRRMLRQESGKISAEGLKNIQRSK